MKKFRKEQIEKEIQRVLGKAFLEDIKLEELKSGFVSITFVKLDNEGSYTDVYVSVLSKDPFNKSVMEAALKSKEKMLRKALSDNIPLRHTPVVRVHLDTGIEEGVRISNLIQSLNK
ncbi:MAG: 30S ribosome-binding factor RbfA [Fusobacteria bacterium]|nr:30S ribosome-binding factor RbfA [Fusobacteriota bacterium]